jgi:hypothetical protein
MYYGFLCKIVKLLGFEPRLAESKSDVLPLHHSSIFKVFSRMRVQNYKKAFKIKR